MANRLVYGANTFTDDDILSGSLHAEQALIAETLGADTATFTVESDVDLTGFTYGDEIDYYSGSTLIGVFYLVSVRKLAANRYSLEIVSAVGLLIKMNHKGGVYFNKRVAPLIDEILDGSNITYTVDNAVGNNVVSGYLKYGSKRDNLQQVLFACGASLFKQADGSLLITYSQPEAAMNISNDRVYMGGSINYKSPVTLVSVTEHLYYQSPTTTQKELYAHTGAAADHEELIWDSPVYNITADTGITIHESGANYVIFSGTGKIYGYEYVHIQTVKSSRTAASGDENEISISDATLVSALNSANVLSRVKKYYSQTKEIEYGLVLGPERTGNLVAVRDPYGDRVVSGYIKDMEINVSNTLKSETVIVTGWQPTDVGNNFDAYVLISESGTFTPPANYDGGPVRLVIVGGATGGQGGTKGENGTVNSSYIYEVYGARYTGYNSDSQGGVGGQGGKGGVGLMVNSIDLNLLTGSLSVTIGEGGAGGLNGNAGSIGGATQIGSYSSNDGALVATGFVNFLTGDLYGLPGEDGINGAAGGGCMADGESVVYNGTTRSGAANRGQYTHGSTYPVDVYFSGGGGGATGGNPYVAPEGIGYLNIGGGNGGYSTEMSQAELGQCGAGGSGGGGMGVR